MPEPLSMQQMTFEETIEKWKHQKPVVHATSTMLHAAKIAKKECADEASAVLARLRELSAEIELAQKNRLRDGNQFSRGQADAAKEIKARLDAILGEKK
jgi:hypothetical protein